MEKNPVRRIKKDQYTLRDLLSIMKRLRGPKGCPWDRRQTHSSICPSLIEETYEFIDVVRSRNPDAMTEELGDLLLHVVFHAEMGRGGGEFDFTDITDTICRKLIRRHPHVFGRTRVRNAAEVVRNWDRIKSAEKKERTGMMDRIPRSMPGLERGVRILRTAYKAGFRWKRRKDLLAKVREEQGELMANIRRRKGVKELEEELGDLLFVLVNLGLDIGTDPERSLRKAGDKFVRRFGAMEARLRRENRTLRDASFSELKKIYQRVKSDERRG